MGPPEISVQESAGGTLHCASPLPRPGGTLGSGGWQAGEVPCPCRAGTPSTAIPAAAPCAPWHLLGAPAGSCGTCWSLWHLLVPVAPLVPCHLLWCPCCQRSRFLHTAGAAMCSMLQGRGCTEPGADEEEEEEGLCPQRALFCVLQPVCTTARPTRTGRCGTPCSGSTARCPASSAPAGTASRTATSSAAPRSTPASTLKKWMGNAVKNAQVGGILPAPAAASQLLPQLGTPAGIWVAGG